MTGAGKIYFASDFHLGLAAGSPPLEREKKVVSWLKSVVADAKEIYLIGDIFDFWWEYKLVVPRGFTRFLGTVSEITDSGIPVLGRSQRDPGGRDAPIYGVSGGGCEKQHYGRPDVGVPFPGPTRGRGFEAMAVPAASRGPGSGRGRGHHLHLCGEMNL